MTFAKNMGNADRVIRLAVVAAIAVAYFLGAISGTAAIVAGIVALVFLVTSAASTCPAYSLIGFTTRKGE